MGWQGSMQHLYVQQGAQGGRCGDVHQGPPNARPPHQSSPRASAGNPCCPGTGSVKGSGMDFHAGREWQAGGDSSAARSGAGKADLSCRRSGGRVPAAGKRRRRTPNAPGRRRWQGGPSRGSDGLCSAPAQTATARSVPWLARSPGTPAPVRRPVAGHERTTGPPRSWQLDSRKSAIRLAINPGPVGSSATSVTESRREPARASAVPRPAGARGCRGVQTHPSAACARST